MSHQLTPITKRQYLIIYLLSFCLSTLAVFKIFPWPLGLLTIVGLFFSQTQHLKIIFKKYYSSINNLLSFILLLAYYIISLSLIYYSIGLSSLSLLFWLILSTTLFFLISGTKFPINLKRPLFAIKQISDAFNQPIHLIILLASTYLLSYFFANPITNGSPTPWLNVSFTTFIIFFLVCLATIYTYFKSKNNALTSIFFFIIIICLVAIKYVLSFGYDTLLHQAALQHITQNGQIDPLSPFYIGQYSLEIVLHFFTSWTYISIERWFVPICFIILITPSSVYYLKKNKLSTGLAIIPATILFIIPNHFYYSSPYAFALVWGIIATIFLHLFIVHNHKLDFCLSITTAIASAFIHPFVGLSVLICVIGGWFYVNSHTTKKITLITISTFMVSSSAVVVCFGLYNWLQGSVLTLIHPIYYFNNFLNLFNDPIWYVKGYETLSLAMVYFYEKIQFFIVLIIAIILIIFNRGKLKANFFIFIISLSSLTSAWLFMSSLEVSGYSYGDQVNYSYRLLQSTKWLLWPLLLTALVNLFQYFRNKKILVQIPIVISFSLILTTSWYLTYPRNDNISYLNFNNIRAIDYQAIDLIYQNEKGKHGYLVFANQLFGAGAIQRYSFGPYYSSPWGQIFYYSVPMGGELNQRFEKIMNLKKLDPEIIYQTLRAIKLNKAYLVTTDYWPLSDSVRKQVEKEATHKWNINNQINLYLFELKQ